MRDEFIGFNSWRGWSGHRARRGDTGPFILQALKNKPMHGYEIINYLEEQSHGFWRPSAGSVYPNLQLLEEQELVSSKTVEYKKIYTITDKGLAELDNHNSDFKKHFERHEKYAEEFKEIRSSIFEIMTIFKKIAAKETDVNIDKVQTILDETKAKLAKLLDEI
jgi:DNA-binding PadR family transcriptional regulator